MRPRSLLGFLPLSLVFASGSAGASPYFENAAEPFSPSGCVTDGSDNGCWTNYMRLADLDGDDNLDAVFVNHADFFGLGSSDAAEPLKVWFGDGTGAFTDASATAVGDYTARVRQVALGDVDGDGDLDMFAPSGRAEGDAFFINDGAGVFTDELGTRLPGGANLHAGATRFGDVDGDGDLDLVVADGYTTDPEVFAVVFVNDGTGVFEKLEGAIPAGAYGVDPDDIDFVDVDRDFDLDLVLNAHHGDNSLWINDGTGHFTDASDALPPQPNMYHYNVSPCDVDGDGDLDLWIENMASSYTEQLLINDGAGSFTDETAARVSGNASSDDNGVLCADVDDDGDLDAIVLAVNGGGGVERLLVNDGAGNFTLSEGAMPSGADEQDATLWGELGDVDGDGRLDLVTAQGEAGALPTERLYLGASRQPVDDEAPRLLAVEVVDTLLVGEPTPVRFAVADRVVTDGSPWLRSASVRLTLVEGEEQSLSAHHVGGDLFWAQLPAGLAVGEAGSYTVCAEDLQGNASCSDPVTFLVEDAEGSMGETDTSSTDASTGDTTNAAGTDDTTTEGSGSETGSDTAGLDRDAGGCGCRSSRSTPTLHFAAWLVLLAVARRRIRR